MSEGYFNSFISKNDQIKVSEAVRQAELVTSGEIVCVIVKSSSTTNHCLQFIFLFLIAAAGISPFGLYFLEPWVAHFSPWLELVVIAGTSIGLSRVKFIQRKLVPQVDQKRQCDQRALLEFYENRVNQTQKGTGILIFTSLFERKIVVLADHGINAKVKAGTWANLVKNLEIHIKKNQVAKGYIEAIGACKTILQESFPIEKNDQNELKNDLILKE